VEIYRLGVRAVGVTPKPELARHSLDGRRGGLPARHGTRHVRFDDGSVHETPVYLRGDVPAGAAFDGPVVIDQLDSTTLVPPGWHAEVDEWLNIRMHETEGSR
jgi:N-methylhydantoinase A